MKLVFLVAPLFFLVACSKQSDPPIKIAINPWPGYEYLFLAQELNFFQEQNLNIELVPFGSLSDAQRAYVNKRVDGMASTIIEVVQASVYGDRPLKIVLVPDYSNGGDVVVARSDVSSIEKLKGKNIGAEVSSLGIYMLHRTLAKAGLSFEDIHLVNVEQSSAKDAFVQNRIDAFVTYPPYSLNLLKLENMRTIFTSAEIPFDVIDTLSLAADLLTKDPTLVPKLHQAWQKALDYAAAHPNEANQIMADRQGISVEEFTSILCDVHIINQTEQKAIYADKDALQNKAIDVCEVLNHVGSIEQACNELPNLVYQGSL